MNLIPTHKLPVVVGVADRLRIYENLDKHLPDDKWAAKHKDQIAHMLAFAGCALRAQQWMSIYGHSEVAMFITEDAGRVKRFMKAIHAALRDPASDVFQIPDLELAPLSKIIDTIHFAGKKETNILQLADVCAFVIKRRLMDKPYAQRFFGPIAPSALWNLEEVDQRR